MGEHSLGVCVLTSVGVYHPQQGGGRVNNSLPVRRYRVLGLGLGNREIAGSNRISALATVTNIYSSLFTVIGCKAKIEERNLTT